MTYLIREDAKPADILSIPTTVEMAASLMLDSRVRAMPGLLRQLQAKFDVTANDLGRAIYDASGCAECLCAHRHWLAYLLAAEGNLADLKWFAERYEMSADDVRSSFTYWRLCYNKNEIKDSSVLAYLREAFAYDADP